MCIIPGTYQMSKIVVISLTRGNSGRNTFLGGMYKMIVVSLPQGNSVRNTPPTGVDGGSRVTHARWPRPRRHRIRRVRLQLFVLLPVQHAHTGIDFCKVERANALREFRGGGEGGCTKKK